MIPSGKCEVVVGVLMQAMVWWLAGINGDTGTPALRECGAVSEDEQDMGRAR